MSYFKHRHSLKKKDKRTFLTSISKLFGVESINQSFAKLRVEILEFSSFKLYLVNDRPIIASCKNITFPTLHFDEYLSVLPKAIVDMGAVPYICNGADIMAPGLLGIRGDFDSSSLVVIIDEKNRKPISIARSLYDSEILKNKKKGKVLSNLHYISDIIWNSIKELMQ